MPSSVPRQRLPLARGDGGGPSAQRQYAAAPRYMARATCLPSQASCPRRPTSIGLSAQPYADCLQALNRIEEEVAKLSVPLAFADQLYHLWVYIERVRQKVPQAQTKLEP